MVLRTTVEYHLCLSWAFLLLNVVETYFTRKTIISGCDSPTEKLRVVISWQSTSACSTTTRLILQSYREFFVDSKYFLNFIETTKVTLDATLVTVDITRLYANIPQGKGTTVCWAAHGSEPPTCIPERLLEKVLRLILQETSFQLTRKQTHDKPWVQSLPIS